MSPRLASTAIAALLGATVGSASMMVYEGSRVAADAQTSPKGYASVEPIRGGTDQDRIVAAVKRDEPSVVALDVDVDGKRFVPPDPFAQFFGEAPEPGRLSPYHERASGSGFVYSRDGLIVTNAHVVKFGKDANVKITVVFANGDRVPAHIYAADPRADIALVKVDNYGKLPPPLVLAHSGDVVAGQWAIALGEPFALQHSVSVGVVSGFDRTETIGDESGTSPARTFSGLLQTSAPINPGNSGGPLIDDAGRVIGINQSVASPQGGAQGIGFAVPADTVKQQVAFLEQHPGEMNGPPLPYLGLSMQPLTADLRQQLSYRGEGVAIEGVFQGGPADAAGLQPGDVIQEVNGKPVATADQVVAAVRDTKPGEILRLKIWSAGFKKLAAVTVGTAPDDYQVGEVPLPQSQSLP
jgi:S1-C subfamily serine protease